MSRYEPQERIAVGGMGEVWRARDTVLGREVALKLLKPELAQDPTFRERFAAEARNAASLHHPHIATVFDYGAEPSADDGIDRPYLVMELVRGRPLSDLLQAGRPMPPEPARRIATQVADALAAAHAAGIVHRDIKPANILVLPDGQVKVTDFGIARAAGSAGLTSTGEMIGTPHYISPEQAEGRSATPASDVYSLGVVLFEMLAGRRPFAGDTPVATALAHVQTPAPELPDEVPPDLRGVVRTSLAKDPGQRYRDAAALGAALEGREAQADAPTQVAAVPTPPPDATAVMPAVRPHPPLEPAPSVPLTRADDDRRRRSGSRVPAWAIVVGVVAVVVLITAVVLGLRNAGGPSDGPTSPSTPSDTTSGNESSGPSDTPSSKQPSPTEKPTKKPTPTRSPTRTPSPTPTPTQSSEPSSTPTASSTPTSQGRHAAQ